MGLGTRDTNGAALNAALSYAASGWHVLPLAPRSKGPINGGGVYAATMDSEAIGKWWTDDPARNVAIATGAVSRLLALDVDPRAGGDAELEGLEAKHGPLPHTVRANTGGGGEHILLRHPEADLRSTTIAPGLEIKAKGCYIVAPPSVHPDTGARYEWDIGHHPDDTPLADPPDWLVGMLPRSADTETAEAIPLVSEVSAVSAVSVSAPEEVIERTLPSAEGQRNGCVLDLARGLKFNLGWSEKPVGELKPVVRQWWQRAKSF